MRLEIRSLQSSEQKPIGGISGIEAILHGKTYRMPDVCANQRDYERGERCKVAVITRMFNYHHVIGNNGKVTDREIEDIKSTFSLVKRKHRPEITSVSFVPQKKVRLAGSVRKMLLELQKELGATFIGSIEAHRNQGIEEFRNELDELDCVDTNQIKSPTVNIQCSITRAFREKFEYAILNDKYPRVNVVWGGYRAHYKNWKAMQEALAKKTKWCNVVGIFPRRTPSNKPPVRSNIAYGLAHGAHTFSFGKTWFKTKSNKSYVLNGNSWYYDETQNDYSVDVARSLNVAHNELKAMCEIVDTPKLENYYMSRGGLHI